MRVRERGFREKVREKFRVKGLERKLEGELERGPIKESDKDGRLGRRLEKEG